MDSALERIPIAIPDGYELRSASTEDAASIAALIWRYDERVAGMNDFTEEDLRELMRHQLMDLDRDTFLIVGGRQPAGFAMFWQSDPGAVLAGFGLVDPDQREKGLGSTLLQSLERRAGEVLEQGAKDSLILRLFVDVKDVGGMELTAGAGFEPVRLQYTMVIDLDQAELPDRPEDVTIRGCARDDSRLVFDLIEETFTEHWGHVPGTYEDWSHRWLARPDIDPSLWWIAMEGDEPIGVLMAHASEGVMGWVAALGVRDAWRRKGIGAALLRTAFREFKARGAAQVGLGVDSKNDTGAVGVYENAGMHVARCYETFEKTYKAE